MPNTNIPNPPTNLGSTLPVSPAPTGSFATTFLALKPEIDAVKNADLLKVNINVPAAVLTVRGAVPRLVAMRPEIEKTWKSFDFARFDKLEAYALATAHAEAVYMFASQPAASIPEMQQKATETLNTLLADAAALAHRGYIDPKRIDDVRIGPGYKDTAFQLLGMVNLLRDAWPQIAGHTGIQANELFEAEALVDRITLAVARRNASPVAVTEAQLTRQRAFTLMANAYELARSAVVYLRREQEDADDIAPSLYAGRGGRKKQDEEAPSNQANATTASTATAAGTVAAANHAAISNQPASPAATHASAPSGPLLPALRADYPGNDPFKVA